MTPHRDEEPGNPTYIYLRAFIDELQRSGLHNVVICPGSRSTPLAMVFAEQTGIKVWMHIDERSAAFFALGMAKRLQQPVALLCTSGTAAANFFPAVVEAKLTHVPLLILTADRPHELRENGAPQAIDQNHLYGTHAKWFTEVALPEATNAALRYIRTLACRATGLTQAQPAGPVHLNMPLREPLIPVALDDEPLPAAERRDLLAWQGRADNAPYISVHDAPAGPVTYEVLEQIKEQLEGAARGLIIAGPGSYSDQPALLMQLARHLKYPLLADPLSQLRTGSKEESNVISSYDAFLRSQSFVEQVEPEVIVRFGAMPTSKPVLLYMKRYPHCPQIVINGYGEWEEPTQLAASMIHTDAATFCEQLLAVLTERSATKWLSQWVEADTVSKNALQKAIESFEQPFEGRIFLELAALLPERATLYVGNSMPVRDLDTFFWHSERKMRVLGNRGANGIDGLISSALGVSAAQADEPVVLVVGDLSFLHDQNGLLAARLHKLDLTIVLVNNDGGGIFSFLPQAAYPEHFEQLFGTPTGLDFSHTVKMYGGNFARVRDWERFRTAVREGIEAGGLQVIELVTDRASNVGMHRQLWQRVDEALQ